MKIERDYLTANEIRNIAETLLGLEENNQDFVLMQCFKYLSIADACTDFKLSKEKNDKDEDMIVWSEDKFDELWANGGIEILDNKIRNIYLIDDYIANKHSTYNMFKDLTEKLGESIKNFDITDFKSAVSDMSKIIDSTEKK